MKTTWKVGYLDKQRVFSSVMRGSLEHEYKTGQTTFPKVGYLFAYDSLSEAKRVARSSIGTCVVMEGRGEVVATREDIPWIVSCFLSRAEIERFWADPSTGRDEWYTPAHTVFLSEFTPTRLVPRS